MPEQKLFFKIDASPTELTLTEAFAGAVGTVTLGREGVHLWVPSDEVELTREIMFDMRNRPITPSTYALFQEATKGRFMSAHVALLSTLEKGRIAKALEYFDYVLIPSKKIRNLPRDFRCRILSYT